MIPKTKESRFVGILTVAGFVLLAAALLVVIMRFEGNVVEISTARIPAAKVVLELTEYTKWEDEALGEKLMAREWDAIDASPYLAVQPYELRSARMNKITSGKEFIDYDDAFVSEEYREAYWLQNGFDQLRSVEEIKNYLRPIDSAEKAASLIFFEARQNVRWSDEGVPVGATTYMNGKYYVSYESTGTCIMSYSVVYAVNSDASIELLTRGGSLTESAVC